MELLKGDLAYDTTDDELQVYDGSSWVPVSSSVVTPTLDQVTDVGRVQPMVLMLEVQQ